MANNEVANMNKIKVVIILVIYLTQADSSAWSESAALKCQSLYL